MFIREESNNARCGGQQGSLLVFHRAPELSLRDSVSIRRRVAWWDVVFRESTTVNRMRNGGGGVVAEVVRSRGKKQNHLTRCLLHDALLKYWVLAWSITSEVT